MIKKIGSGMKEPRFLQPMTLEFNSIFHPDPLENFEFAKEILNGVKQIEISNDKMIYSSTLNIKRKKQINKMYIKKGIFLYY